MSSLRRIVVVAACFACAMAASSGAPRRRQGRERRRMAGAEMVQRMARRARRQGTEFRRDLYRRLHRQRHRWNRPRLHPSWPLRLLRRCRPRKAGGLDRRPVLRQHLRNLRPRTDARLHPQPRHHQRERGAARRAALQRLFRAEPVQWRTQYPRRPAGRRCRVLRQPDRRSLHQRHLRLAGHQGHQSSGRRSGAADRGARAPRQGRGLGQDHRVRRGVQRRPGRAR